MGHLTVDLAPAPAQAPCFLVGPEKNVQSSAPAQGNENQTARSEKPQGPPLSDPTRPGQQFFPPLMKNTGISFSFWPNRPNISE